MYNNRKLQHLISEDCCLFIFTDINFKLLALARESLDAADT